MLLLEFTIEPFVEGQPGPHVTTAVAAAQQLGATVDFGPFGSSCTVAEGDGPAIAAAVLEAAFANGATHVSLHAERLGGHPTDRTDSTGPAGSTEPTEPTELTGPTGSA